MWSSITEYIFCVHFQVKFKTRQIGLVQIAENVMFIVHLLHIAVVNNEMVATVGAVIYAVVRVS